jgi:hypothetical protein
MKINLEGIQNLFAELQVKAGKVPLLESNNDDLKLRLKRYENTEKDIMNELNNVTNQRNDLLKKIDEFTKNSNFAINASGRKSNTLKSNISSRSGISSNTGDILIKNTSISGGGNLKNIYFYFYFIKIDNLYLYNTINQLQREKKLLKTKLLRDKYISIVNTQEDSYMNKLIQTTQKKDDFDQEIELYQSIEENVVSINKKYSSTRAQLCKPKIFDLTDKSYDYNKIIKTENLKNIDLRMGYMKEIDSILGCFFSSNTNSSDNYFKDVLDNDITKYIQYYGEPKIHLGRISLLDNNEKFLKNVKDLNENNSKEKDKDKEKVKVIPLYLSEKSMKYMGKCFGK